MDLKSFTKQAIRVLKVVKKPTKEEVKTISKVTALGMLVIGLLGFLIQILVNSIMGMF